ncbi:AtpZ/AtpI family protein [Maricaulis sp.]|uniref:AtpZ/AtpI family protein n=1 Tax=Maricaulis sp. TaxID=1486257 RepID=UPI002EBB54BA|nr:AtpZ/AtpI family protein [Pseudomonadota bacterium]|tara:strand:- start:1067 stop:1387 length:321 start_codon:yes stop_codon:yes gene_type:complete
MSRKDESPRDPSKADLDSLQQRIDARREKYRPEPDNAQRSAWQLGMRYGSEFFGGVLVGGGLGFALDHFAGISPWGLIAGTMFGFAAGTLNVVRAAQEISSESQER